MSGAEIGIVRLLGATDAIDATVILAQEGPLEDAFRAVGATVEVLPMAERSRSLSKDRMDLAGGKDLLVGLVDTSRYVSRLRARLARLDPDIVHTISMKAGFYGTAAARLAGIPVIWNLYDRIAPDYLPSRAVPVVRAAVATLPDMVLVPSRATLRTVGRRRRGVRTAIRIQPVEVPRATPRPQRERVTTIGMVGRLTGWKGQDVFLDAFARAFPNGNVRARVIGAALFGEDAYADGLREQAERAGVADRVDFAGFRSDVPAELERLDVLVHASVTADPLATVVLEGMAAGVPTVSTDEGGHSEHVTDGHDGLLYPAGDPAALAVALRRVADDWALRERLAIAGLETARRFSPPVAAAAFVDLYERFLDDRRHSAGR
ncbi:MAG: glycosyltransferase family 4 protein [Solirubrobacteraceae bacterium]